MIDFLFSIRCINILTRFVTENYYVFWIVFFFFSMLGVYLPLQPIILLSVIYYCIKSARNISNNYFVYLLLIYVLFLLFTIIGYIDNGRPISLYFHDIKMGILPILFFFYANNSKIEGKNFFKTTSLALLFCFIVGLYLYFFSPEWYVTWKINQLKDWLGETTTSYVLVTNHFSSFFSHSYFPGYMSLILNCIVMGYIFEEGLTVKYIIIYILSIVVLFLSLQRISIVVGVLFNIIYFFLSIKNKNKEVKKLFYLLIVVSSIFVIFFAKQWMIDLFNVVYKRVLSVSNAVGERSDQWTELLKDQKNFIIGHGFGSAGQKAFGLGFKSVTDGEFFKFLYETGIIGVALFFAVSIMTIIRGLKNFKYFLVELPIVTFFTFAIIGANPYTLMYQMISIYWFCVGRIWNDNYLKAKYDLNTKELRIEK